MPPEFLGSQSMRKLASIAVAALSAVLLTPGIGQAQMPPPPLEYYGDLAAVEEARISPSGTRTALLMSAGGQRVITILDSAGTPIKQIVVGDAKVRSIEWVGEDAILLQRTETGRLPPQYRNLAGDRKIEWWRGNVIPLDDNQQVVSIFADQRSIVSAIMGTYGVRNVNGRWVGYFGGFRRGSTSGDRNRRLDDEPALFAVDLATGDAKLAAYAGDYPALREWLVDADGEVGARLEIRYNSGRWKIENGDGQTIAEGSQARGDIDLLGFDATGTKVIYWIQDDAEGRVRRYAVPLTGGDREELWPGVGIHRYIFQPYTSNILGVQLTDRTVLLSDETKQSRLQSTLDLFSYASEARIVDFDPEFRTLIARTSGNYDSGTWYRVDGATNARSIVGLERPAIQGPVIGNVSTITYEAQDGLEIRAILTLPPGREPANLPAIVLPHGGPTAHDSEGFDWLAQAFASKGYAVLQPNFRGSTGRGLGFIEAGDGEWGRKMQSDKSDGLMALAEQGIVDPDRACIVGASYGGYAALAGVTLQQGIYRCAVSINGVSDLEPMLRFERTGSRDIFTRSYEKQFGADTDLDAISPRQNASKADAPVLLIHGRDDTVVPIEQSFVMRSALRGAGKEVEFIELDGEDHYLSQPETRKRMLEAAVAFALKHNPPN